ncbi:MAG: isochorismatase family protein, partial [Planctomycetales bacterium]|nr:isochorismatase family protein [Planctomycetales bacterium]
MLRSRSAPALRSAWLVGVVQSTREIAKSETFSHVIHNEPPAAPPDSALLPSPARMRPDDTGLLVIDMQGGFLAAQPEAATITFQVTRLLEAAAALGVRSAATEQVPEKLGATLPELAGLLSRPARAKTAFSAGACGELFRDWRAAGIDRVL